MGTLVNCLLKRLEAAESVISDVTPAWAKETWESIVGEIDLFAPDVLIFANAREPTDRLLTTAARLSRTKPKVVMELPNLFPKVDMSGIDAIIAPSHFAALHHSILDDVDSVPEELQPAIHVINPSVDTERFKEDGPVVKLGEETCGDSCPTIGFVGRISSEKSPGIFIATAKIVHGMNPFARFVVVGDGKFLEAMKLMAEVAGERREKAKRRQERTSRGAERC